MGISKNLFYDNMKNTLKTMFRRKAVNIMNPRRRNEPIKFFMIPKFSFLIKLDCVCSKMIAGGTNDTNKELMMKDW